ncbi:MAG TPA: ABC transporter ATP-binding protein [Steroidobacteraceae bacterium]
MMSESGAITLEGINVLFGAHRALIDVNLTLAARGRHALAGPNGSGKTTLLKLLAGLLIPATGTARYADVDLLADDGSFVERLAYVTQEFSLYAELSIDENLAFVADLYALPHPDRASAHAQKMFGLTSHTRRRTGAVSAGLRQRLMLAAAFMRNPTLMLLDEPTAALDEQSRDELWHRIDAAQQAGTTIVFSTHSERDLERCDSATRLLGGRVIEHRSTPRA